MNKVQILGNMVRDCELKYSQSGVAIGSFGIAYNEKRKDAGGNYIDVPMFFDVTAFGKTAENIQKFFSKGSRILLDGSLDFQSWEKDGQKRSKVGIKVNGFDFIDKKEQSAQGGYSQPSQAPSNTPAPNPVPVIDLDEENIPF